MPDTIPQDVSTTSSVTVGGPTTVSALDFSGDHDWFRVNLTAGQAITVTLNGVTLPDPYLRIRDSSGAVVYENDDINLGVNLNSQLSFAAQYTGVYYIDVGSYESAQSPGGTGDYQLNVTTWTQPPIYTNDQIRDQLTSGYWGDGSHRFILDQTRTITVNITGLDAAGQNLALTALGQWSSITGINFAQTAGSAQITFDDNDTGAYTDSNYTNGVISTSFVNVDTQWLSDYGPNVGGYAYQAYLHEIGHALGLGHAGNYNTTATYPYDAIYRNDAWATSIMSYFDQVENTYFAGLGFDRAFLVTPMVADILAMQQLYGLSTTTLSGNTTYGFNSDAGNPFNASILGNVAYTIFDTGGIDTMDYSGYTGGQTINLNPETFSDIGNRDGNVSIARGTIIENAIGGSGRDVIIGNSVANVLTGGGNIDTLTGNLGNDTFQDTTSGLNGDTITDFSVGDKIVLTDATFSGFTFNLSGNTLTYTGGSATLSAPVNGTIVASAAAGGGVQLIIQGAAQTQFSTANLVINSFGAGASAGGWTSNNVFLREVADVNGDGRADIIAFGQSSVYVALGNIDGSFAAPVAVSNQFTADIGWANEGRYPREMADVNGDGRADIVGFGEGGVYVSIANPNGTFAAATMPLEGNFGASAAAGGWTSNGTYQRTLADANGDGRADIVAFGQSSVYVALGSANGGFLAPTVATTQLTGDLGWANENRYPRELADVNGDGRADIVGFGENGVYVALANSNGTFASATLAIQAYGAGAAAGGWTNNNTYLRTMADVDGDGRADIVAFGQNNVFVSLANPNGTFTDHVGTDLFTVNFGWTSNDTTPRILADINGDGAADIVGFGLNGTYIALSNGDIF